MRGAALLLILAGAALAQLPGEPTINPNERPTARVVRLLKDFIKQIEQDNKEFAEIHEKFGCWCDSNIKETSKNIAADEGTLNVLNARLAELSGSSSAASTTVSNAKNKREKKQAELDAAAGNDESDHNEFMQMKKELTVALSAAKDAGTALKDQSSLLQAGGSQSKIALAKAQEVVDQFQGLWLEGKAGQAPSFLQIRSSTPAFDQIFGILQQMTVDLKIQLDDLVRNEEERAADFAELRDSLVQTVADLTAVIGDQNARFSADDLGEKEARTRKDETVESLQDNRDTLAAMEEKCKNGDAEWDQRQKTQAAEMSACQEAIKILSGDNAQAVARATTFVQIEESMRSQALKVLARSQTSTVAALRSHVKLDAFQQLVTLFKKAIDELKREQSAEVEMRDSCVKRLNTNKMDQEENTRATEDKQAEMDDANAKIDELNAEIKRLTEEINAHELSKKDSAQLRFKENQEFATLYRDNSDMISLLDQAIASLNKFYASKLSTEFMQKVNMPGGAPEMPEYKSKDGTGVIRLLTETKNDCLQAIQVARRAERNAQSEHEQLIQDLNKAIDDATNDRTSRQADRAEQKRNLAQFTQERDNLVSDGKALVSQNGDLHGECDFLLEKFDYRQQMRQKDIEATQQAIAIFQGAKP